MAMRFGVPYRIRNTVVEFEEGRRIGVTETFDPRSALAPWLLVVLGFPRR